MQFMRATMLGTASFMLSTTAAFANGADAPIPEPNMVTLLAMASAGILIGRRMSSRRPPEK